MAQQLSQQSYINALSYYNIAINVTCTETKQNWRVSFLLCVPFCVNGDVSQFREGSNWRTGQRCKLNFRLKSGQTEALFSQTETTLFPQFKLTKLVIVIQHYKIKSRCSISQLIVAL